MAPHTHPAAMLARRYWRATQGGVSRAFSLAAQHRRPTSSLHDLVGDANQPGLLGGYGVKAVALVDVNAGEVIFREKGELLSSPSMHSIQTGIERHCQIDGEGRYTAHSFSPNTAILIAPLEPKPISFVALRPIPKGEEISFDYTTTEWELGDGGFVDASTSTPVRGFKHLADAQKRRLLDAGLLPAHIIQLWLGEVLLPTRAP